MENISGGWSLSREVVEVHEEAFGQGSRKLRMRLFMPQLAWIGPVKQRCQQVRGGGRPLGRWEAETAARAHLGHAFRTGISGLPTTPVTVSGLEWVRRWLGSAWGPSSVGGVAGSVEAGGAQWWLEWIGERGEEIFLRQLFFLCIMNLTNKYVITQIKWNNLINILCPFLT